MRHDLAGALTGGSVGPVDLVAHMIAKASLIALCAALLACAGLGVVVWWQSSSIDELRHDNKALTSELRTQIIVAEQAKQARAVADARAARFAARAADLDTVREGITENADKTLLPDLLRDTLDRVYRAEN